jgi:hypothetical protein
MVSGTLAVTTTPQSLQGAAAAAVGGGRLYVQVIGAGTVVIGGKVGVAAGNGIQIASTMGPIDVGGIGQVNNLADVYAATLTGAATLMWMAN